MPWYNLRDRIWYGLLDCSRLYRYYGYVADRWNRYDRLLLFAALVFSSSAAASILAGLPAWVGGLTGFLAAAFNAWSISNSYAKDAALAAQISVELGRLLPQWGSLWSSVSCGDNPELQSAYDGLIRRTHSVTSRSQVDLPLVQSLNRRASAESRAYWTQIAKAA